MAGLRDELVEQQESIEMIKQLNINLTQENKQLKQ